MKTAFDPATHTWNIDWPGRVARHDLVYLTPPTDPMQGWALGNGEVGALCWCEESRIIVVINRTDLWDDAEFDRFQNWDPKEEDRNTTLRYGCRIVIDFGHPIFDIFYLADFDGRLSLADATVRFDLKGPFGTLSFQAFVDDASGAICSRIEADLQDQGPIEIQLERYGSRTYAHWYRQVSADVTIGLAGTEAEVDESTAFVFQDLTSGKFATACRVDGPDALDIRYERNSRHRASITVSGEEKKTFTLWAAISEPLIESAPEAVVRETLRQAKETGFSELLSVHAAVWKAFWLRSLLDTGDAYLDNLWHLAMYYANSCQRGKYPGNFINGLWAWSRDVKNWNFYFHWNQQQVYWPLNAAGHSDLCESYLNLRFKALPYAKEDAKNIFSSDGAFVSDVTERRGYNSVHEFKNHTPVAQIAMDFWRQYQYTQDENFLRTKTLPYLIEAAKFFESLLGEEDDGYYHAMSGAGYEGWTLLRDAVSELVCARILFTTAIKALQISGIEEPRAARWSDILARMTPIHLRDGQDEGYLTDDGRLAIGSFKGDPALSSKIISAGYELEKRRWSSSIEPASGKPISLGSVYETIRKLESDTTPLPDLEAGSRCNDGIFPWVEYSAIFPSGGIGIADKGKEIFGAAQNTTKLFSPNAMGWNVLPIALARLGLSSETWTILRELPGKWQFYANGWGHYGPQARSAAEGSVRFRTNTVEIFGESESREVQLSSWPFRHMGMEAMSVLSAALNETLLQSYEGIIRVGCAVREDQEAKFTLHAVGGFAVSAELKQGQPLWIAVQSKHGEECRLYNPWKKAYVFRNGVELGCFDQEIISISTQKGDKLWLSDENTPGERWESERLVYPANMSAKTAPDGLATLGMARMF